MNEEYINFIGFYRNVFPNGYCQFLIDEFNRLIELGLGKNRLEFEGTKKHHKDDCTIILNGRTAAPLINTFDGSPPVHFFFEGLLKCFKKYVEKFPTSNEEGLEVYIMKMQCTPPGGGYHVWHHENGKNTTRREGDRVLVYSFYLNSFKPEQAGETEFYYQQLRVLPEENMMIIWPADWTHTHRGNVVHGKENKYIITGWFNYG